MDCTLHFRIKKIMNTSSHILIEFDYNLLTTEYKITNFEDDKYKILLELALNSFKIHDEIDHQVEVLNYEELGLFTFMDKIVKHIKMSKELLSKLPKHTSMPKELCEKLLDIEF